MTTKDEDERLLEMVLGILEICHENDDEEDDEDNEDENEQLTEAMFKILNDPNPMEK